jgi:hypothetical protein
MEQAKRRSKLCALCGQEGKVTREHFVPRCLWAGPLPPRVETVPTCVECNQGGNHDDDYFRNILVMMFGQDHPQKQQLFAGKVQRSLLRNKASLVDMLQRVKDQPMYTPSGLWIGNAPMFPLEKVRFDRNLQKIIKGLYFLIRKAPMPAGCDIKIIGHLNQGLLEFVQFLEQNFSPVFNFGDDVFEWRFFHTRDGAMGWKLAFYRSVVFYAVVFTNPIEDSVNDS